MTMMLYRSVGSLLFVFLLSIQFAVNNVHGESTAPPKVTIPQGTLLGTTLNTRHGRNISAFRAIPFGKPPIDDLRFANPVPADGWDGILDVTTDASMCPQTIPNQATMIGNEDCLHLKVFTPQLANNVDSSLLPVMVYIYGGAFRWELPSLHGPQYLLDEDIILVVINHRVGSLGYLSTGDEVASGNWGLKDQVLALKWVRDNIRYFGGDPDQVTIFGESAGAAAVELLTLSDTTKGLFNRIITQSGSALASWTHQPRDVASKRAFQLGEYVGCNHETSDSLVSCLRKINVADIIVTEFEFQPEILQPFLFVIWSPTDEPDIEGAFLTDSPTNLVNAGKIRDLPSITGVNKDEGLLYSSVLYSNETILKAFLQDFDNLLPTMMLWSYQSDSGVALTKAVKKFYFDNDLTSNSTRILEGFTKLVGDAFFNYPAYKAVQRQRELSVNPQYLYSFEYQGAGSFSFAFSGSTTIHGVAHCDELIYLFPHENFFQAYYKSAMSETDYEMVDRMVQLWTSFAINGTPTNDYLEDGITWKPYSSDKNYLRIGNRADPTFEIQGSFFPERMQFWTEMDATIEM